MTVGYESAIGSHVGIVRSNNQDSGYAGDHLFLVADGMGGHAGGDVASATIAHEMAELDTAPTVDAAHLAHELSQEVLVANRKLRDTVKTRPELAGLGTTLTAIAPVGDQLALAHIGDSRLYLYRDRVFSQVTKDHTFVQRLVDSGKITEEEAQTHPRRSVLMRVLGDVEIPPDVDTDVLDTRPGDVWLLCSDGLCGYVTDAEIEKILRKRHSLQGAVDALIDRSLAHGAPDNVTVVLVETTEEPAEATEPNPRFAGSAASSPIRRDGETSTARNKLIGRKRPVRKPPQVEESHFEPRVDEYLAELLAETRRRNTRRRIQWALGVLAVLALIAGAIFYGYQWTQSRYFVGTDGRTVVIFQGINQHVGSFEFYSEAEDTEIPLDRLANWERRQVERSLGAGSIEEAREIVLRLRVVDDS